MSLKNKYNLNENSITLFYHTSDNRYFIQENLYRYFSIRVKNNEDIFIGIKNNFPFKYFDELISGEIKIEQ